MNEIYGRATWFCAASALRYAAIGFALALAPEAPAQIAIEWANVGTDFATDANWLGGIPTAPANDLITNTASFGTATPTAQPNFAAGRSVAGVVFASTAGTFTLSGTGSPTLTLGTAGIDQ